MWVTKMSAFEMPLMFGLSRMVDWPLMLAAIAQCRYAPSIVDPHRTLNDAPIGIGTL